MNDNFLLRTMNLDVVWSKVTHDNEAQNFLYGHFFFFQIGGWLKKKDLPVLSKFRFGAIKKSFLDKAKQTLEEFIVVSDSTAFI